MPKSENGKSAKKPLTIVRLETENVKGIKAVAITPDGAPLVVVGGRCGQGKCVPEGTPVALWDGSRKPIEDIRETDLLVGLNADTWQFQPEHPLALCTSGVQEVFEVKTYGGFYITATAGHRLLSPEGWKPIEELAVGGFLAIPMRLPGVQDRDAVTEAEATLIGLLLGDGCLTEGKFVLCCGDEKVAAEFARCVNELFPACVIRTHGRKHSGWNLYVSKGFRRGHQRGPHQEWLRKLGMAGKCAYDKFVPEVVFASGSKVVAACLAGLLSTDGWMTDDGHAQYYTRSESLVHGARRLFLRLGIPTSLRTRQVTGKPFYSLTIVTHAGRSLCASLLLPRVCRSEIKSPKAPRRLYSRRYSLPPYFTGLISKSDRWELRALRATTGRRGVRRVGRDVAAATTAKLPKKYRRGEIGRFLSEDVGWDPIVSITPKGRCQTFDLQMPSEAFVANEFIVHNSSLLDSIAMAIGGAKLIPPKPIRDGQDEAHVKVDLGDLVVERHFTASGSKLIVKNRDGAVFPSAQAILNELTSQLSFDPLEFSRHKPAEQLAALRAIVGLDFTTIDAERKRLYEERTLVNREAKAVHNQVAAIVLDDDTPEEEVRVSELVAELKRRQEWNHQNDVLRENVYRQERQTESESAEVQRLVTQIAGLQAKLAELDLAHRNALVVLDEMRADAAELDDQDTDEIEQQISTAETINAAVRRRQHKAALSERQRDLTNQSDTLTVQIDEIDADKAKQLAEAKFPVDGLGFDDNGVTYQGRPFEQACGSERLRVSAAIGFAQHPRMKVLLIREGSNLDETGLELLSKLAEAEGGQVWLERVSEGSECSVIVEDGMVKPAPELAETF